jgi:hypothetical protein
VAEVADLELILLAPAAAVEAAQEAAETVLLVKLHLQILAVVVVVVEYQILPTAVAVALVLLLLDTDFNN